MIDNATNLIGIGIDIVSIADFETRLERTPGLKRNLFTDAEIAASLQRARPEATLAGVFAAKESLLKSLGVGLFERCELNEIEVSHRSGGQPYFSKIPAGLEADRARGTEALLSISHCAEFAVASVSLVRASR